MMVSKSHPRALGFIDGVGLGSGSPGEGGSPSQVTLTCR